MSVFTGPSIGFQRLARRVLRPVDTFAYAVGMPLLNTAAMLASQNSDFNFPIASKIVGYGLTGLGLLLPVWRYINNRNFSPTVAGLARDINVHAGTGIIHGLSMAGAGARFVWEMVTGNYAAAAINAVQFGLSSHYLEEEKESVALKETMKKKLEFHIEHMAYLEKAGLLDQKKRGRDRPPFR